MGGGGGLCFDVRALRISSKEILGRYWISAYLTAHPAVYEKLLNEQAIDSRNEVH